MKLYAILIGINDYPGNDLSACLEDVNKVKFYLNQRFIKKHFGGENNIVIKELTDQKAKKENVISEINKLAKKAKDEDVVMIYYSGHGGQEESGGVFKDEQDGLIECMVCHHTSKNGNLLADKEIRYLFSTFKNSPHLLTVFDCCHSGDMTREGFGNDKDKQKQIKRIDKIAPQRDYTQFCFHEVVSQKELKTKNLADLIPHKNHIHIAACMSSESSWEESGGGVFTQYLLQFLKASNSQVSYQEIARWASISMNGVTREQQTPVVTTQGQGKLSNYSSWLGLEGAAKRKEGMLVYNKNKGWYYDRGTLFGVRKDMKLDVELDSVVWLKTKITEVNTDFSKVDDSSFFGHLLNTKKAYPAYTSETAYTPTNIYINNLEDDADTEKALAAIIKKNKKAKLVKKGSQAHFDLNIFNQMVYFSFPDNPYRPINQQFDLLKGNEDGLGEYIRFVLPFLNHWQHLKSLYNADKASSLKKPPIKMEIQMTDWDDDKWLDVTEQNYQINENLGRTDKNTGEIYYNTFRVRITNVSNETWYVGAFIMTPAIGIYTEPFDKQTVPLKKGESKLFFDFAGTGNDLAAIALSNYMEVYNWRDVPYLFKFIYSSRKFDIQEFAQPELHEPITSDKRTKSPIMASELKPKKTEWGTTQSIIRFINPEYDIISGELKKNWEMYMKDERLSPFIKNLYYEPDFAGSNFNGKAKAKSLRKGERGWGMDLANFIDDKRRWRKFRAFRKRNQHLPVIVAEGDSWFLFPLILKDTIDWIMKKYPVRSLAAAGDTLANYRKSGQLLTTVKAIKPDYVLISGGGNDIIGPDIVKLLKDNVKPKQKVEAYLNDNFDKKMKVLEKTYRFFIDEIAKINPDIKVFLHGYDYVRSFPSIKEMTGGWANKYMIQKGIDSPADRKRIIHYLIDRFNDMLDTLDKQNDNVVYVNMRGKVRKDEWHDEIHPNNIGYKKIADAFLDAIENAVKG